MIENPFIIAERIIPKYFCDREKESAHMIKLLKNGNNVVLISQRRVGKTGLIQFCYDQKEIKNNFLTIYVDILSTNNLQEFTYILAKEIFDVVKTKGKKRWMLFLTIVKSMAAKISIDPFTGLPTFNLQLGDIVHPQFTLKEIFQYISESEVPCILAIDEFQRITCYPEQNIEALLRSHLLQINNCRMIFSGSEKSVLANMFMSSSRPFYLSSSFLELTVIPKEIYTDFIVGLFKARDKTISYETASKIYDMFDGITFYVQRVCNGIFSNTKNHGKVTDEIIYLTLDEILYSYDVIYRLRLSQITTRQKELLLAIAKSEKNEKITSTQFVKKYSLSSSSAVQTSLKALIKDNLVIKTETGYIIDDRFFRIWLIKNF